MAKKEEDKTIKLTLSDGTKVEFDPAKGNGNVLHNARKASGYDSRTVIFLLAEIATFDGEKMPAEEILNKSAFDIIALENAWASVNPFLKSQA